MKKLLSLTASALLAFPCVADTFSSGGFTFTTTSEGSVELSATDIEEGDVTIPETVTDDAGKSYTVTSIGATAFMSKDITSLTMPNTVTSIGNEAFKLCRSLKKVRLSDNLTVIGANAFQTTRNLAEINWPATLKSIQAYAFKYSTSYAGQIRLPKGISVDDYAFVNMSAVTSLWLDGQPSSWGVNQCESCKALTKFYVNCLYPPLFDPSETFATDEWSWEGPTEITLYVPVGAKENYMANEKWTARFKTIEEYEFTDTDTTNPGGDTPGPGDREYETYSDTWSEDFTSARLNVPEAGKLGELLGEHKCSVKELALSGKLNGDDILCLRNMAGVAVDASLIEGAILETLDLTNCEIVPGGQAYYSYLSTYYTEQDAVGPYMFNGCYSLKSFTMPKYAASIGTNAFAEASGMTVFNCNAAVRSVGELAFYNCKAVESIDLPDECSKLGDMAFYVCSSLKNVHLPSTLTMIPFATFYFCESLDNLTLPAGIKNIEDLAFHNCASLKTLDIPASTYKISPRAFGYCEKLTALTVDPENTDYCDIEGVLFNKSKTTLVIYPVGREQERYEVPAGTVTIGEQAMSGSGFRELVIPEGVTAMLPESAGSCKRLARIEMPASLTTIERAFDYCPAICDYIVAEGNPEFADIDGVLCNAAGSLLIKYPAGRSEEEYTVPGSVSEIGEEAFCSAALKTVTLSEGVATVGINAFAMCESLATAYLPASLTLLREGSFGLTALQEVHCAGTVPPVCEYIVYEDGVGSPFVGVETDLCKLYVPEESIEAYATADVWKEFEILGVAGIESVEADSLEGATFYTMDGRRAGADATGLIIVRTAGGRVFKTIKR